MNHFVLHFRSPLCTFITKLLLVFVVTLSTAACSNNSATDSRNAAAPAATLDSATLDNKTANKTAPLKVIAYYMGDGSDLARYNFNHLTHIIYSFLHLNGNQLAFDNIKDQQNFARLVALKKRVSPFKSDAVAGWLGWLCHLLGYF